MRPPSQILQKPDYGLMSAARIVAAVAAFKERFGAWPEAIHADAGMVDGLREHVLTELGCDLLRATLDVHTDAPGTVIAAGNGQRLEYGDQSPSMATMTEAAVWIWGTDFKD